MWLTRCSFVRSDFIWLNRSANLMFAQPHTLAVTSAHLYSVEMTIHSVVIITIGYNHRTLTGPIYICDSHLCYIFSVISFGANRSSARIRAENVDAFCVWRRKHINGTFNGDSAVLRFFSLSRSFPFHLKMGIM